MEMGTIRTKVSRSHREIIAFLFLTFCNPNPTYDRNMRSYLCVKIAKTNMEISLPDLILSEERFII